MKKRLLAFWRFMTPVDHWAWFWSPFTAALTALVWTFLSFLLLTQRPGAAWAAAGGAAFRLTWLLFFFLICVVSMATRSLLAGGLAAWLPFLLLGLVNYFKLSITGTPFRLDDLTLAGNVGDIVALNAKSLTPGPVTCWVLVLTLLWAAVLWLFSKPFRLRSWKSSLSGALLALCLLCGVFWQQADALVFSPLGVPVELGILSQTTINDACGFPLGLLRAAKKLSEPTPASQAQQLQDMAAAALAEVGPAQPEGEVHPNVILILSESFFDITTLPGVTYEEDPLANYRALTREGVWGTFHTRTLGYGTSNIELELLTGINTHLMSDENLYTMDPLILRRLPTVPKLLRNSGYRTVMLHTFNDGIYHRAPRIEAIGFSERYFSNDFAAVDPEAAAAENYYAYIDQHISGTFVSDAYLSQLIIDLYENNTSGKPLFAYGISMEAHTPYDETKYAPEELTAVFTSPLSGEAETALAMYSQAVANADAALGDLVDYFREVDDPTVILFFGDHRPGLGLEGSTIDSVYSLLGEAAGSWEGGRSPEEIITLYSTSYLIWANDPDLLPAPAGTQAEESTNYFGLRVLEAAQVSKPLFWRVLEQLSETRIIDTNEYSLGRNGEFSLTRPRSGEDSDKLDRLSGFLWDALYHDRVVTNTMWK